jgi:23S rRNA (adenine2503-C2)-methyltransferase
VLPVAALTPSELAAELELAAPWRGKQIFQWLHRSVFDFAEMTDLPQSLRHELAGKARPLSSGVDKVLNDPDGTVKYRIKLLDGSFIESVLLSDNHGRKTACLSTQVGCAMGCRFCSTGRMGLIRNLADYEIVEQFFLLRKDFSNIDTIVFMGMGEPLCNLKNLSKAVEILNQPLGVNFSLRRLTLSTCGLLRGLRNLVERGPYIRLAFSLITADPHKRGELMPVSRENPLREIKKELINYQNITGKRITLEVVLIAGITDRREDLKRMLDFIPPLKVLVNLIPWNPVAELPYEEPSKGRVEWFERQLADHGIPAAVRFRRGRGVAGACGQLAIL